MALDQEDKIDAVGIENGTDMVVLTIADAWDWQDERKHLKGLQTKLNAYVNFIESGQIWESYPAAEGRRIVIDVVTRFPIPEAGLNLLERVSKVCAGFGVEVRSRHHPVG